MLLDTISVDIIAQIRRKQLSRYLLYLVFGGWSFFLRGFYFNTSLSVLECSPPRWGTYHHLSHVTKIFFSDNCLLCWHFGTERLWTKAVMAIRVGWICSAFLALLLLDSLDVCTAQPGSLRIWVILLCCKNLVLPWFCYAGRDLFFWVGLSHGPSADIRAPDELRLLALTVATDETDGYKRFMKSAKANRIDVKVFFNYLFASMACGSIQRAFCFSSPFVRAADFVIVSLPSLFVNVLCVSIVLQSFSL